jgi:hypothetical protein
VTEGAFIIIVGFALLLSERSDKIASPAMGIVFLGIGWVAVAGIRLLLT